MAPDRFQVLIVEARRGDEAAWAEIFGELAPQILGYLRGSGAPDPENVLGETFLQVARDIGSFDGDWGRFRSWTFTIAHHRLIDARRGAARRPVELREEPPEPELEHSADAEEEALARISNAEVRRVLSSLSPDQRAVLLLRVLGDLSIDDCAKALGKRSGAIKQLQRRGLAAVRRLLEKGAVTL